MYKSVIAGGGAGVMEILTMYPTDVLKTRAQLSTGSASMAQIARDVYRQQGIRGFYRGIGSPILAEAPKRAWKFAAKDFFSAYTHHAWLAGAAAGATETLVNNPFETIKVRMQAKENIGKINSLGEAATMILRQDGVTGLYRGFQAQFSRNAVWNAAYFGIIGAVPPSEAESKSARLAHKFAVGSLGSMVGTLLNTPFDVVKSRMQFDTGAGRNLVPWIQKIYAEEGFRALYKGLGARLLRLGPGGGIMIVAYDSIMGILNDMEVKNSNVNSLNN